MDKLRDVNITPLAGSVWVQPKKLTYTENGIKKERDLLTVHSSVLIIIYNVSRNKLVFVKQFRPAVYYSNIPVEDRKDSIDTTKYPANLGFTLELCAGTVDKNKSIAEIAKEEVLEECGYDVPLEKLELIHSHRVGPGKLGAKQTMFYCEVTDDMKVSEGGGVHDEMIEVVELTVDEIKKYISQSNIASPGGFMGAMYWFLLTKSNHF